MITVTTDAFDTIQRRVSWVDTDGTVYQTQWFSDAKEAQQKYEAICGESDVKRAVMHKKEKVKQYDRPRNAEPNQDVAESDATEGDR